MYKILVDYMQVAEKRASSASVPGQAILIISACKLEKPASDVEPLGTLLIPDVDISRRGKILNLGKHCKIA